jgi:hypothetical protein
MEESAFSGVRYDDRDGEALPGDQPAFGRDAQASP